MSDIRLLKLLSGEELLAKTTKHNGIYKLEDPLRIVSIPVPLDNEEDATEEQKIMNAVLPLKKNIKIFHFIPMARVPYIEIKEDHVVFEYEPISDVVNNYTTFFGNSDFPASKLPVLNKIDNETS